MDDLLPKWFQDALISMHHYMKGRGLSINSTSVETIYGVFTVDNNDVITRINSPTKANKPIPPEMPT